MALVEVGKFDVTVRLMDDLVPEKITPTVHPDEKIGMLVERIQKLAQVQEVILQYRNEVLQHHCTIGDYGINRESTVYGFPSVNPHPNCRFCLACRKRLMKKKLEMRKQEKSGGGRKSPQAIDDGAADDEDDSDASISVDDAGNSSRGDGLRHLQDLGNEPLIVDIQGKVQLKVQEDAAVPEKRGKNKKGHTQKENAAAVKMTAAERVAAFEAAGGMDSIFDELDDDETTAGGEAEQPVSFENLLEQMKLEEEASKSTGLTAAQKKRARKKKSKMKENKSSEPQ